MDEGRDEKWLKFTDYPTLKVYYRLENGRSLYTFYCEKLNLKMNFGSSSALMKKVGENYCSSLL